MEIIEIKALRGPNYYSRHPVILMKIDIKELEIKPTDLVPNFKENLDFMLPTLKNHKCSPGRIGGFYERIKRGTWAGHVVEHIAIELQCLAGQEVAFGKTYSTDENGIYKLVYRYIDENTGLRAGEMSVNIVEKLFKGEITDISYLIAELKRIGESSMLGPSTQGIINEAIKCGIPYIRLNEDSYVQLGHGKYQRRIQATMMDNTSALGVEIADDKARTKSILSSMGIPVAKGICVKDTTEALQAAEEIGYPLVVKPLRGNHGRGVSINIKNPEDLVRAIKISSKICENSLVEKYLEGFDFRILVIDGKFVAATLREPAYIIGNGRDSIKKLIEEINKDPKRGEGHENILTKISVDYMVEKLLENKQLTLESILEKGEKLYVKSTANLSSGGTAKDVTDTVHTLNKLMSERISRIVGLNVMGIDIIAPSLEAPLKEGISGILEVNAAPGFRMHLNPQEGKARNVGKNVIDMLFPTGSLYRVPIVAITGTNGKTTTTRLISHILRINGSKVGMTSTDSVTIDNIPVLKGDYSGPEGVLQVMQDSTIDHAVFEIARGGILRRGLGFNESDVGVLLNISADHLGEGGITTIEELTRLKSTVTEAVKESGYSVFNAEDSLVLECLNKTKASPILFSKNPENQAIKINYEKGNINVVLKDKTIIIQNKGKLSSVASVMEIPITFSGQAEFNIENVLAAVAVATALGLNEIQIRAGLISFNSSIDQSPGRMNIIDMGDFKILIDYGHNPGAIIATGDFIKGLMPGRKIRMTSGVGNRRNEDILKFGACLSKYYDDIIICDSDSRGRKAGETAGLVKEGLLMGGFQEDKIRIILNEKEATKAAIELAEKGDLVVLQVDDIQQVIEDVLAYKEKLKNSSI